MAKKRQQHRKDNQGRVLNKGESQRKSDGMYIYTYTDPFGKRNYVYSKDLYVLRQKEELLLKTQKDGLDFYVGGQATINMAFDRYMAAKYNLRETTRSNYNYMFDKFVRDTIGKRKLTDVKYTDVKFFYMHLLNDNGIQINTLDNIHSVLHPIFDMAVRDELILRNPADGVMAEIKKSSGKNKGIRHALTPEQQEAFISAMRKLPDYSHWYPLFLTLVGTGMRVGELIGLRWKDVDFSRRSISVNHSVAYYMRKGKACFGVSETKTEKGIREIPMMDAVYEALMMEYERQKREGFCTFELDGMSGFVFSNRNGKIHNPHCLNLAIKRIYEAHNAKEIINAKKEAREPVIIPHFSCHHLRHTFCTRMCEAGINIKVIQEIMGHANVETTLDIYTEVNFSLKQKSFEELSKKMNFI